MGDSVSFKIITHMNAVIKKSVYRNGGTISWTMSIHDVITAFKQAEPASQRIGITSAEKGFGKSTALEYLSRFSKGLSVDGDIMSTLALLVISKRPFSNDLVLADIAKGKAVKGFLPWEQEVNGDKKELFTNALSSLLGDDFNLKISLCTTFYGCALTAKIIIVPDYGTYKIFMSARTKAMLADKTSSTAMSAHVMKYHKVLTWDEFSAVLRDHVEKQSRTSLPVWFCPNFGPNLYGLYLDYVWISINKCRPCPEGTKRRRIPYASTIGGKL